jgi:hypothetical protein
MDSRTETSVAQATPVATLGWARALSAALLLVVQVLAYAHLAAVEHALDANTGTIVHTVPGSPGSHPLDSHTHDECDVFAVLTQASPDPAQASTLPLLQPLALPATGLALENEPLRQRKLHRLSPSHSPPLQLKPHL